MFGFFRSKYADSDGFEEEALPLLEDVYRVALWLTRNVAEAQDLTQETFVHSLKAFHRYERGTNCKAWLMTILYRTNAKRLRKLSRMRLVDTTEETIAETVAFEAPIPQSITDEEVLEALKQLPELYRSVVLLADVEDLAYKEVAEVLGIPIGTVMSRLHRGRKLLRAGLTRLAAEYGFRRTESATGK